MVTIWDVRWDESIGVDRCQERRIYKSFYVFSVTLEVPESVLGFSFSNIYLTLVS